MMRYVLCLCVLLFSPALVEATPILQLYVEGATYNAQTESWEISGFSDGSSFRLWALGNVAGPGGKGAISNVRLAAAYSAEAEEDGPLTISLSSTRVGGTGTYNGIEDDNTEPGTGTFIQHVTDGSSPILGDGSSLPAHGIYGSGINWQEFSLGEFTATTDTVADFIDEFPTADEMFHDAGQINAYDITVTGFSIHPVTLHFDLYDTIVSGNHVKAKFAPFSHDADADVNIVPEPSSLAMTVVAVCLLGGFCSRRLRRTS